MDPMIYKPSVYKGAGIYNNGGGKNLWEISTAFINGNKYQTIKKDGVEWLAQNLNEVFAGLTLSGTPDTYNNTQCFRAGLITSDYDDGSVQKLIGVSYKAGCRAAINTAVSGDGWRIPSKTDWTNLVNSLDDPHDLCHPICKCDYGLHDGTNKTGMSIINLECGANSNLGKPSTIADYMTSDIPPTKTDLYMVISHFYNAKWYSWSNNTSSATWYNTAFCRLVRNY